MGGIFINAKEGVPIRATLQELGHKQPKTGTPIKTDNSTTHGIVHNNVRQKKSRCFDTGPNNKVDYVTKQHAPALHKAQRPTYLYAKPYPQHIASNILSTRVC